MDQKNRIGFYLYINGMSGADLAETAGLSQPAISNALKRNRASPRTQQLIAEAFATPVQEIFPNGTVELKERRK